MSTASEIQIQIGLGFLVHEVCLALHTPNLRLLPLVLGDLQTKEILQR